jgi:hypothetical protein
MHADYSWLSSPGRGAPNEDAPIEDVDGPRAASKAIVVFEKML